MTTTPGPDLDETRWQAWNAMALPEGFHAEIVEGFIEVSPTGHHRHSKVGNRLRRELSRFLDGESKPYVVNNALKVIHERQSWIPDAVVCPEDDDRFVTDDGLGLAARGVRLVAEVVSPGQSEERDRVRKRRAYARAGIPVYVLVDDQDGGGSVTVLAQPAPEEADYRLSHRVPYGAEAIIPEGPAKGFVIGEAITGPPRNART
ncbi:Uma2 family endonuclease [Streptomyces bugieae]|uniref:Uma2 family endonuclease n=1 Tax=Streptomyces bugieae TaxID=3098223 RepID=A0ABU7NR87_9ACTN|nr:Uma2 family endonuclease [Streptomyces sp. DSM 41528]